MRIIWNRYFLGIVDMLDCDIVLTVYNNIELTRKCLDSLVSNFRPQDRLIIIDNGSDSVTQEFLKDYSKGAF